MQYIFVIMIAILFFGCSTIPPKVEYRVNSKIQIESLTQIGCKRKTLKIAQAFSPSTLLSHGMSYGIGDSKQYVYSAAVWSISPNRAITAELLSLVRGSKLFNDVQTSKSRSRSDIILELNIEDFMQYFNDVSTLSHANVVISLSLIDTRKNTVFASETFRKRLNVQELSSNGGVKGLNLALNDVLEQSNLWLAKVCK